MNREDRRAVLAIAGVGVFLIGIAVIGARAIIHQMLQRDAVTIAQRVAETVLPGVGADGPANRPAIGVEEAVTGDYMGNLTWYAAFDTIFRPLAWSAGFSQKKIISAFKDPAFRNAYTGAFVNEEITTRVYALPGQGENSTVTTVFIPATYRDGTLGVIAVNINQTQMAAFLNQTLLVLQIGFGLLIAAGMLLPFAVIAFKIRRSRITEERLRYLSGHDTLTGLANRTAFQDWLGDILPTGSDDHAIGILLLDIDRFKEFNDANGHHLGDQVLVAAARRIEDLSARCGKAARLSSDEFAVVCKLDDRSELIEIARQVRKIGHDLRIRDETASFTVSIGAAVAPFDGNTSGELIRSANIALHRAKAEGGNTVRFFESCMDDALRERRAMEHALRRALQADEIEVHYQPQISLRNGRVTGYEALARWDSAEFGMVSPSTFIPLAEETGLIEVLSDQVLRKACTYARGWPSKAKLAVNLSPVEFAKTNLVDRIRRVLSETDLPAARLELEITEGVLLEQSGSVLEILNTFRALGISIAMDDFGTGYSSLRYVADFAFTKIKIDRSFIAGLNEAHNEAIVRTIMALGASLGMVVTAEGVETEEQAAFLREVGCDFVQGFLVGRPMARIGYEEILAIPDSAGARRSA